MKDNIRRLNFGCGNDLKESWVNADISNGADINFDFNKFPYPIKDNSFDYIETRQVLQLLDRPDKVLHELHRIAKPNIEIKVIVGYYHNKGQWNDILTKHAFSEITFQTFVDHPVELDSNKNKFEIIEIEKTLTIFGKLLLFEFVRKKLDLFISGIYSLLIVRLKVKKN